jgi:hypothetical protein
MFMIPFFFCGHGFAFLCLFLHALRLFMLLFELCNLTVLLDDGKTASYLTQDALSLSASILSF